MDQWTQIQYRDFWDVPRAVIARLGEDLYFFDSRFDESSGEYLDHYEVWRLPPLPPESLAGSWAGLAAAALERMPDVGIRELPFDVPRPPLQSGSAYFGASHAYDLRKARWTMMPVLRAGLAYFAWVFGAGFLLALVRIPFLVPRFGVRTAELLEAPVMLLVILFASRWLARRYTHLGRARRLLAGSLALGLLVLAELAVAWTQGMRSFADIIASRDPVSGSVYLGSLLVFAIAPAIWPSADR